MQMMQKAGGLMLRDTRRGGTFSVYGKAYLKRYVHFFLGATLIAA